jgi:hypothetical protein
MDNFPSYNIATKATEVKAAKTKLKAQATVSTQPIPPTDPQVKPEPAVVSERGGGGASKCLNWYCCPCCE